jgi:hypothetical protein
MTLAMREIASIRFTVFAIASLADAIAAAICPA